MKKDSESHCILIWGAGGLRLRLRLKPDSDPKASSPTVFIKRASRLVIGMITFGEQRKACLFQKVKE